MQKPVSEVLPSEPAVTQHISTLDLELRRHKDSLDLSAFSLYGKFLGRIELYSLRHPSYFLHGVPVTSMTLYFVDDVLYKIKCKMAEDISSRLLTELGNCTFKPRDEVSRALVSHKSILVKSNGRYHLNPLLSNYVLSWDEKDQWVSFQSQTHVRDTAQQFAYFYSEETKDYQQWRRMAERITLPG